MLLCELKILRELDSAPFSSAVQALGAQWRAGWSGETKPIELKPGSIDEQLRPIIEEIVSKYPVTTNNLSHQRLKEIFKDDVMRKKGKDGMAAFDTIVRSMFKEFMTGMLALRDHGLKERVALALGRPFETWKTSMETAFAADPKIKSKMLTTDADDILRINSVFSREEDRKLIIDATMSGKSTEAIVIRAINTIKKSLGEAPKSEKDKLPKAEMTINTIQCFIGFCRALLENQASVANQIAHFIDVD